MNLIPLYLNVAGYLSTATISACFGAFFDESLADSVKCNIWQFGI
jgi:hypothetical protein